MPTGCLACASRSCTFPISCCRDTVKLVKTEPHKNDILLITNKLYWSLQRANDKIYISYPVNTNGQPLITLITERSILPNTLVMVIDIFYFRSQDIGYKLAF